MDGWPTWTETLIFSHGLLMMHVRQNKCFVGRVVSCVVCGVCEPMSRLQNNQSTKINDDDLQLYSRVIGTAAVN